MNGHFFDKKKLDELLKSVVNKTLGQVDVNNVFDRTIIYPKITGIAGDVIEQSVLGYEPDNKQEPDLNVDGIRTELKTTGIRYSKKKPMYFEAKEPMSITAVSPETIINEEFETSNFWKKLEHTLLVFYHYDSTTTVTASQYADFVIEGYMFHEFILEEKKRLEKDWLRVRDYLINLHNNCENPKEYYHLLSFDLKDKLMYIDTSPKWPNPPRFRLKRKVVTSIVQSCFGERLESLPGSYLEYSDIDNKFNELKLKYSGMTIRQLKKEFNINRKTSKSISEQIVVQMFGGKSKKINKIELFSKIGVIAKTLTMTSENLRTEDMKLFSIDFNEWTEENIDFEDSYIYDYFSNNQFICIIFEEPSKEAILDENRFIEFKRLSFTEDFIQKEVKNTWEKVRNLVLNNKLVENPVINVKTKEQIINKNGIPKTSINFPKSKNNIIFVRGSGKNSGVKTEVLNNIRMYKQYIWIKGAYISGLANK